MIRSFADKDTERLFNSEFVRRFPPDIVDRARKKLLQLDVALSLDDLRVPASNRIEKLRGPREGQYSIRVNDQWRLCFRWRDEDSFDVEVVDYH